MELPAVLIFTHNTFLSTSSEFKTCARVFPVCLQRVARVCCLLTGCSRDWQSAVVMRFVWDIRGQHVEE